MSSRIAVFALNSVLGAANLRIIFSTGISCRYWVFCVCFYSGVAFGSGQPTVAMINNMFRVPVLHIVATRPD